MSHAAAAAAADVPAPWSLEEADVDPEAFGDVPLNLRDLKIAADAARSAFGPPLIKQLAALSRGGPVKANANPVLQSLALTLAFYAYNQAQTGPAASAKLRERGMITEDHMLAAIKNMGIRPVQSLRNGIGTSIKGGGGDDDAVNPAVEAAAAARFQNQDQDQAGEAPMDEGEDEEDEEEEDEDQEEEKKEAPAAASSSSSSRRSSSRRSVK